MHEFFGFPSDAVVTPMRNVPSGECLEKLHRRPEKSAARAGAPLSIEGGAGFDLARQFLVFQLSAAPDGPAVLEPTSVDPAIAGSPDEPDVLMRLELLSFHVGSAEAIDPQTRATLRINIGKDESSTDKKFETAFFAAARGTTMPGTCVPRTATGTRPTTATTTSGFGLRRGLSALTCFALTLCSRPERPRSAQK